VSPDDDQSPLAPGTASPKVRLVAGVFQSLAKTPGLGSLMCLNTYYESGLSLAVAASNWF
jgi:hypothetical protein